MGLTIQYTIRVPAAWSRKVIRAKLEEARQFAKGLPVVSVSELAEFKGRECDFRNGDDQDPWRWAKIQAQRSLFNPWFPGMHGSQSPNHMFVFSVQPAEGCEPMNVGSCSFPRHVWEAQRQDKHPPLWSQVFDAPKSNRASLKLMRAFLKRWSLRRLRRSAQSTFHRFGGEEEVGHFHPSGMASATIWRGKYLSHRKGYAGSFGLVALRDQSQGELHFRQQGSAQEAKRAFASPEFRADLNRLVQGEDHVTEATFGFWSSFCKTQFSHDPRLGGWENFATAHLAVVAILEHLQSLGFKVWVHDEGGFWKNRSLEALAKEVGEWDTLIAGMTGTMKDMAEGMPIQSAMSGRPDFERLEAKAHADPKMAEMLKNLKRVIGPKKKGTPDSEIP